MMTQDPSPAECGKCQAADFELVGAGLWDGKGVSGVFYKSRCRECGTVWGWYRADDDARAEQPKEEQWHICDW